MNLSHLTAQTRYVPHTYSIHQHLGTYETWIDSQVGTSTDRVVLEANEFNTSFFLPYFVTGIRPTTFSAAVESATLPPGCVPRMKVTPIVKPNVDKKIVNWDAEWRDTPVSVKFKDCIHPVVYLTVDFVVGTSSYEMTKTLLIIHKSEVEKVLAIVATIFETKTKTLEVIGGASVTLPENGYQWGRVVLHPETFRMVKTDFETFIQSQEWFVNNDLPFRRGYLFYGPPGNGKTSAIRVMASHPLVTAFTIDMGNPDISNSDITTLFTRAANRSPSLIVLEDVDRMFAKQAQEEERRKVTLQHLLNCLDGVASPEGTIVVATANEPTDLDPALLKRPGRFDRVVEFRSPEIEERREYYRRRKNFVLTDTESETIATETDGFTFAQLRESYIIAGQTAFAESNFDPNVKITFEQLQQGIKNIKSSLKSISRYQFKKGAGFSDRKRAGFGNAAQRQEEIDKDLSK